MAGNDKWGDLVTRLGSAVLMVLVGFAAVWFGGHVFHVTISLICGLMVWELVRMIAPNASPLALQLGGVSALAMVIASYLPGGAALPLLLAPALVGFGQLSAHRAIYAIFCALVLLAGFSMISVRDDLGFGWMLWLISIVVVTDVMGYFAGRMIGGPKFWPKISPKKTWSGTAVGWVGAAVVGFVFAMHSGALTGIVAVSIALSLASQMGDIAESAIKRKMNVKDSSTLIPGHGGVLDRFDGMLGASVFLLVISQISGFPLGLM